MNKANETELKPCPFCGKEAKIYERKTNGSQSGENLIYYTVGCLKSVCNFNPMTGHECNKQVAIDNWNTHLEPTQKSSEGLVEILRLCDSMKDETKQARTMQTHTVRIWLAQIMAELERLSTITPTTETETEIDDGFENCTYCGESKNIESMIIIDSNETDSSWFFCSSDCQNNFESTITPTTETASECDRWISVDDRLPEENGDYIAVTEECGVNQMNFQKKNKFGENYWGEIVLGGFLGEVTHWMPLPTPPTQNNSEVDCE